jgi:outer membrane protein insertion porin family
MTIKDVALENYDEDSVRIKITIFEGIQYQVGKIDFEGNTLFTAAQIRTRMKMLEGKVYSPKGLDEDLKAIKDVYGEKGYVDTDIKPERQANIESGKMDLVYKVTEGPQFYVEKIVIQGNNRTKDKVLRRELALAPGDVYDTVRAEASKKRLENLGYFDKVDVSDQDTNIPGRKNMVVTVDEKRTGSITFGVGFSTVDSVLGFVELQQGNFDLMNFPTFTGGGQKFRTRVQYGLQRRDFTMNITEPWFLNQKLSLGWDLFYNEYRYLSALYNERRYGSAVTLSRALNQFWTTSVRYQYENYELFDIDASAPPEIANERGWTSKSSVRGNIVYDTRDNVFLTRKGERAEVALEGAGGPLMGDTKIWKIEANGQKYFLLPWDLIVSLNAATGVVNHYDNSRNVPLFDRYFIGGSRTVRGFAYNGIGPHDGAEPIGGRTMGYGNAELSFPIIDRIRGAVFFDTGFNNDGVFDYSFADYEAAVGFGLRLNLPIGPLRMDFGFPVVHDSFSNQFMKFNFDVGYQF